MAAEGSRRDAVPASDNRVMEMREAAVRYCSIIEQADSYDRASFAAAVASSLAEVIGAACALADVTPTEADLPDAIGQEEWGARFAAIQGALGEWGAYSTTLAPYGDEASEAVMPPIGDDLADVWRDLKRGLLALDAGAPDQDVIWEWRFGFYSHWGRHATEALRALHARLAEDGGPPRNPTHSAGGSPPA